MATARTVILILIFAAGLDAQIRTYCEPDGRLIAASQGYAPKEAANRLLDYYNYSGPSYYYFPPDPSLIRAIQSGLTFLGYAPGGIDGRYHETLGTAIVAFEEESGVPQTGVMDYPTLKALINQLKDVQEQLTESDCVIPLPRKTDTKGRSNVTVTGHDWVCK